MERQDTAVDNDSQRFIQSIPEVHLLCQFNRAWFEKEGEFYLFSVEKGKTPEGELELCRWGDIALLLDINPTETIEFNLTLNQVAEKLAVCYRKKRALSFAIDGLNSKLKKARPMVIKKANELCADEEVRDYVRKELLTHIPSYANENAIAEAIQIAENLPIPTEEKYLLKLYQELVTGILPSSIFIYGALEDREIIEQFISEQDFDRNRTQVRTLDYDNYGKISPAEFSNKFKENVWSTDRTLISFYGDDIPLDWLAEIFRFYVHTEAESSKTKKIRDIDILTKDGKLPSDEKLKKAVPIAPKIRKIHHLKTNVPKESKSAHV